MSEANKKKIDKLLKELGCYLINQIVKEIDDKKTQGVRREIGATLEDYEPNSLAKKFGVVPEELNNAVKGSCYLCQRS